MDIIYFSSFNHLGHVFLMLIVPFHNDISPSGEQPEQRKSAHMLRWCMSMRVYDDSPVLVMILLKYAWTVKWVAIGTGYYLSLIRY